jgi:hypothetical protein
MSYIGSFMLFGAPAAPSFVCEHPKARSIREGFLRYGGWALLLVIVLAANGSLTAYALAQTGEQAPERWQRMTPEEKQRLRDR